MIKRSSLRPVVATMDRDRSISDSRLTPSGVSSNAQEIASRAGLLYDKFAGFIENLQGVGERLRQAQQSYDIAFSQLSTGAGNLLRQTDQLRELGARNTKRLDDKLIEQSGEEGQTSQALVEE